MALQDLDSIQWKIKLCSFEKEQTFVLGKHFCLVSFQFSALIV